MSSDPLPHSMKSTLPGIKEQLSRGKKTPHQGERPDAVWKNSDLVTDFVSRVRRGVPLAAAQLDIMMRVVEKRGAPVRNFIDLGCGDGILAATLLSEYPNARGVLVDFSTPMIQAALRNLKAHSRHLHFSTLDFAEPGWFETISTHGPFDTIVSGYSIHHQPDDRKRSLYGELFDLLEPGGLFLNMEHVSSASRWIESIYDDFFIDSLWASQADGPDGRSREEIHRAYHARPDRHANVLAPVDVQCHWLRQIGFEDVDCFFKAFELAIFGGRKPVPIE